LRTCDVQESNEEPTLAPRILREMNKRTIKNLLDVIILAKLQESSTFLGGYDIMVLVHQEFGVLISSGTVYACLYSMERDGLIEGKHIRNKRAYTLTTKGENKIKEISEVKAKILGMLIKIFK
jgi:DNA-binding PadR family transcriptional regulator